jgi:DNA-binding MarR family transcriptional regulator
MSSAGMPDPMAKRLGYALKRAQHALRARLDEALRPIGLTAPQYAVLSAVELEPGISNAALARAAFVTPQTMQGILANLEREGLLRRDADALHGRILRTELTPSGRGAVRRAHEAAARIEAAMVASITRKEAKLLAALLLRCADNLSVGPQSE